MARTNPKPAEVKEETLLVEPGMKFRAIKNCCFDKYYYAGQPVLFSPGQKAPLTLVKLVSQDKAAVEDLEGQQLGAGDAPPAIITGDEITSTMSSPESGAALVGASFVA